jgi:hypothetical protein
MYAELKLRRWLTLLLTAGCLALTSRTPAWSQESLPRIIPPPAVSARPPSGHAEKAVLAGGCYWGTQGILEHVKGIERVVAGFSAGHTHYDGGAESAAADILLRGTRSYATQPSGPGRGPRLSVGYLLHERGATAHRAGLHRAARSGASVPQADRDPCRSLYDVRSGGSWPAGLHAQEPTPPVHRGQRRPEACQPEAAVSGILPGRSPSISLTEVSRAPSRTSGERTGYR